MASALVELQEKPLAVECGGPFGLSLIAQDRRLVLKGRVARDRLAHYDRALVRLGASRATRARRLVSKKRERFLQECDRALANAILRFASESGSSSIALSPALPASLKELVLKKASEQGFSICEFKKRGKLPPSQAAGTAVSPTGNLKGQAPESRSARAHAMVFTRTPFLEERSVMPDLMKDLTESTTHFLSESLDNLKSIVDRTSDEMGKTDLAGMTKRVLDSAIDNTKNVIEKVAEPQGSDPFGKAKAMIDSTLDATKHVINAVSEENKKVNLTGAVNRVIQDGLDVAKEQADLTIDTTKKIADSLMGAMPTKPTKGTCASAKIEVEIDKPKKNQI